MRPHVDAHGPPDAPVVVLVHGAPDRAASFRRAIAHLGDLRVLTYDRRGYGRSLGLPPATSMRDHAEDLLAVVDGLDEPPTVVAHSFGANPTMLAATLRPDAFCTLGLWEPPLPWVEWWPADLRGYMLDIVGDQDPADRLERSLRGLLGDERWDSWPLEQQEQRRAEALAFRQDMASELLAPFAFADVKVPALVGYGTETGEWHVHGARWLAEHLPVAGLHVVTGAGHYAHTTDPETYARFVRASLEPTDPPDPPARGVSPSPPGGPGSRDPRAGGR